MLVVPDLNFGEPFRKEGQGEGGVHGLGRESLCSRWIEDREACGKENMGEGV
jgi:hypothetical protein